MKRNLFLIPAVALMGLSVISCDSKDDDPVLIIDPAMDNHVMAYIVAQGNSYNNIQGSIDALNLATNTITTDIFKKVNDRALGDTPQCGVVYGSKIYIGTSDSHTIEVVDRSSFKSLRQIMLDKNAEGRTPRSMVATGGYVYISMFEGYVARLDTAGYEMEAVKVGLNPEVMCLHDGKLYVPNSEGMNYLLNIPYGKTASVVSLNPFRVEDTFDVPENPTQFLSDGSNLFLLCMGNYDDTSSAVYKIGDDRKATRIADATIAAAGDGKLVIGNHPWGSEVEYSIYNSSTGELKTTEFVGSAAPSSIGIAPADGRILISCYQVPEGGFADYDSNGFLNVYDSNAEFMSRFNVGPGQTSIFFTDFK